jgi:hypothetical protein
VIGTGLYIERRPSGSKLWRLRHVFKGKRNNKALGAYPEVSLAEARERAVLFRRMLSRAGGDPGDVEKGTEPLSRLTGDWLKIRVSGLRRKTLQKIVSPPEHRILPVLGDMPVKEISSWHVPDLGLRPAEDRGMRDTGCTRETG